ncbi:MAG: serine hydrolase [Chitinophagaceae bacterium]|jgi:CubicO group peptidase (beta-lactamase class C family)
MKKIVTVLFLLIAAITFAQKKSKPVADRFAGIDAEMEKILSTWHGAGFAVAVVEKDKIVFAKGYGYKDYEKKLPVTPNTLFAIGSCTKAFTASLMGMLVEEKKVEYDKPIREYFPELKFYNDAMNNQITLRDVMVHRTGLPRHDLSWYLSPSKSRDSLVQRIQYMQPTYGVREKWQYNNFMYLVQGVLAEKKWDKKWEEIVQQKIFDSIGFKTSNFSVIDLAKAADYSYGYTVKNDSVIRKTVYYNIDGMGPAGSINSSVNEMANWVSTWINGGKFNGKQVLPAAYVKEASSSQMVVGAAYPGQEYPDLYLSNYGFGWMMGSYRGHYRVEHGGNIDGFSASTSFFPSDSIGIIVLSNQNGSVIPSMARNILSDRMLKLAYIDWSGDRKKVVDKAKAETKKAEATTTSNQKLNTKPSHDLKDYEGLYTSKGYGSFDLSVRNDSLILNSQSQTWWLRHYHYDVFEPFDYNGIDPLDTTDKSPLKINFTTNDAGDIAEIVMPTEGGLDPTHFVKTAKAKSVTNDELKKYVGEYELGGQTVKVYIQNEKTLYVLVPGQPDYELVANGNNKFAIKVAAGFYVQFEVNDKGETQSLTFMQPNGNFKAVKKK